jgi:hypothetical protein
LNTKVFFASKDEYAKVAMYEEYHMSEDMCAQLEKINVCFLVTTLEEILQSMVADIHPKYA